MAVRKRKPTKRNFIITKTARGAVNIGDEIIFNSKNHAMSLCDQADEALSNLEAKLSNIIRRINSINKL